MSLVAIASFLHGIGELSRQFSDVLAAVPIRNLKKEIGVVYYRSLGPDERTTFGWAALKNC